LGVELGLEVVSDSPELFGEGGGWGEGLSLGVGLERSLDEVLDDSNFQQDSAQSRESPPQFRLQSVIMRI
jgi:hypothetical protein